MTKKKKKKTTAPKKANRGRATDSKTTSSKKRSGGNQTAAKKRTSTAATSSKPKTTSPNVNLPKGMTVSETEKDVTITIKKHKDQNGGHYHGIMETIDNYLVSVGFTSDSHKGKRHTNIKLEKDPLNSGNTSYMRRQGTVDNVDNYFGSQKGSMTTNDYAKAKKIADKAKIKYETKKTNKKK